MYATGEVLGLAVPAAVLGAAAMGLANATQSKATKEVPDSGVLNPQLLWNLLRNRTWLVGIGATVAGLGLQLLALAFGPLLLVQPLLVTALLFTTVFVAWVQRGKVERSVLLAASLCAVGLATFLLLARPQRGDGAPVADMPVLPVAITVMLLVGTSLLLARRRSQVVRVIALAAGTGVLYGLTAALMKLVAAQFRAGFWVPFGHWALYAACVTGVTGFLLSQNTFQHGTHAAPAVAVITTVDPVVAVAIGAAWYGETLAIGPGMLLGELVSAVAIIAGIGLLAQHTERLNRAALPADASPAGRARTAAGSLCPAHLCHDS